MGNQPMTLSDIATTYWPKPIPDRNFDWAATRKWYDAGDPIGYGRTEEEAIADLIEKEEES
jgi:hypothetical protein